MAGTELLQRPHHASKASQEDPYRFHKCRSCCWDQIEDDLQDDIILRRQWQTYPEFSYGGRYLDLNCSPSPHLIFSCNTIRSVIMPTKHAEKSKPITWLCSTVD